MVNGQESVFVG